MKFLQRLAARLTEPDPPPQRHFVAEDDEYIRFLQKQREESEQAIRRDWLDTPVTDRFRVRQHRQGEQG